jgi:hypothetical protein
MDSFIRRLNQTERQARHFAKVDAIRSNWDLFTKVLNIKHYRTNPDAELLGTILKKEFNYSTFTYWVDILNHFNRLYKSMKQ